MKLRAAAISDRGLKREGNEDQYLIDESKGLYIVCDGMGGHSAGEVAAERAIDFAAGHVSKSVEALSSAASKPDGFFRVMRVAEEAVQVANLGVHQLAESSTELSGMGTTMTMLIIVEGKAVIAHVGDSRLYLKRGGEIHQLTVDHTLANDMLLAGALSKEEAAKSRFQHVLTRSIGSREFVEVDTLLFDLLPGDRFLLCSDGLSNYFKEPAVVASFLERPEIISRPESLIDFAKEAGGDDNITAVVVEAVPDAESEFVPDADQKVRALKDSFLGRKLSIRRLLHLLTVTSVIHCSAGKELVTIGKKCPGMFLVLEGTLNVQDDDIVGGSLEPGDCFGHETLIAPAKSPASIVAQGPAKVMLVDRKKFNSLTKRLPRLGNALLRNLSRFLSEKMVESSSHPSISLDDTGPLL